MTVKARAASWSVFLHFTGTHVAVPTAWLVGALLFPLRHVRHPDGGKKLRPGESWSLPTDQVLSLRDARLWVWFRKCYAHIR